MGIRFSSSFVLAANHTSLKQKLTKMAIQSLLEDYSNGEQLKNKFSIQVS
jgi:hypothetical protein